MKGAAAAAARTDLNIIVSSKIYLRNGYPQMMDQVVPIAWIDYST